MSSMAEGSESWASEDELDLGLEEEDHPEIDHDAPEVLNNPEAFTQEAAKEESESIGDGYDQASEKPAEVADTSLPQTPLPHATKDLESLVELPSTPDDTPSLHVSSNCHAIDARNTVLIAL